MLGALNISSAPIYAENLPHDLHRFFRDQMRLGDAEVAAISRGAVVAKMLPSKTLNEILVFGAVFVKADPEEYLRLAFNLERLRKLPGYLGIGRIGDVSAPSDLEGFTLEPEDIQDLKDCKPGKCGLQLPAASMQELQRAIVWSRNDVEAQVNARVQRMAIDFLRRYQDHGNKVLGTYHDKEHPFDVHDQLASWLGRSETLPVHFPELSRYLLAYPEATPKEVESSFYWEKVAFGLKPTLRLNHVMTYRSARPAGAAHVVAIKQLYASHYFQLALDLTECVMANDRRGFYLISLKGSMQQGLSGFKGSLLRKAVVRRTRAAQEKGLNGIKKALETKQWRGL
jgi:hypothetical protein